MRSLTLRPPVSYTAGPMPQGLPFPLGFISHSLGGLGASKGKKVRSYSVAHAPAGEYISTAVHVNSEPLAALSGITAVALPWVPHRVPHQPFSPWLPPKLWDIKPKRKKEWSHPVRQDRAVHRRSEACMAGAQLASLPWLTVDSFGLPPPFPLAFSLWILVNTC